MSKFVRCLGVVLSTILALALPSAHAQTFSWNETLTGNRNENWTNGNGTWSPSAPTGGADQVASFNITGSTGALTINNVPAITLGTIQATNTRPITLNNGNITLAVGSGSPSIENVSNLTIASALSGSQGFTKTGAGRLQINGNNTGLSGAIFLNAGTIAVNSNTALGNGTVTLNGGTLNSLSGTRTMANNFVWNSGNFTNDGGNNNAILQINGTMTLNGTGSNLVSFAPNDNVLQGVVFNNTVSGGTAGNSFTFNNNNGPRGNAYMTFTSANSFAHNINVAQGGSTQSGGRVGTSGLIVGNNTALSTAAINVNAHRFAIASVDASARNLSNNFTFTTNNGASGNASLFQFTLGQATLETTGGGTMGGTGNIGIGNLDISANSGAVAPIARRINVEGSTVGTINGVFSRSGNLTAESMNVEKVGTGTLVLANSGNTYNGSFTVSGGTLLVNGNLGGTGVTVNTGARLGGSGTISAATTINSGGTLAPGNSPGSPTFSGGLTQATGSNFVFELIRNTDTLADRGTFFDGINVTGGTLTIQSGVNSSLIFNGSGSDVLWADSFWDVNRQWLVFDNANSPSIGSGTIFDAINVSVDSGGFTLNTSTRGSFSWSQAGNDIFLNYTAIPEPSTYAMVLGGLAALVWLRRRRSNQG